MLAPSWTGIGLGFTALAGQMDGATAVVKLPSASLGEAALPIRMYNLQRSPPADPSDVAEATAAQYRAW